MVPLPWPSGSFPRTVIANPIVPITAMIADIAAGRNRSDGLFLLVDNSVSNCSGLKYSPPVQPGGHFRGGQKLSALPSTGVEDLSEGEITQIT